MIDIIEFVEENLESMLNSGAVECPSEDCVNRRFHVSIWRDDERGFIGDASCRDTLLFSAGIYQMGKKVALKESG